MANPTTNYGWPMPTSTDLVTDLPADFALFGQPVDTTLKALNPQTTTGALAYRSAVANVNTALAIGSTSQVLTVVSGVPAWVTPASAGGKVLQVVQATYSTVASNSTTTFADTGLTATITPTLNTSKVLVIVAQNGVTKRDGNLSNAVVLKLMRDASNISAFANGTGWTATNVNNRIGSNGVTYLDSPATTSATTYKTQFRNDTNAAQVQVQLDSDMSTITLLEIGA